MTMQRWTPWNDLARLEKAMSQLLAGTPGAATDALMGRSDLPIDIHQTKTALVVKASVPGVSPDEIDISVSGNLLTIRAINEGNEDVSEGDYIVREHRYGVLSRSVTLPVEVDADKADARFDHGVLTITLPKAPHAKAKQVKIKPSSRTKTSRPGGRPKSAVARTHTTKQSSSSSAKTEHPTVAPKTKA